jgi:hypothetical protein
VAGGLGFGAGHSQLVISVNWEFGCLFGWLVGCLVYVEADLIGGWTDGGLTDWWLDRLAAGPIGAQLFLWAACLFVCLFVCLVGRLI